MEPDYITTWPCPHCKAPVHREATKCPHCAEWLVEKPSKFEQFLPPWQRWLLVVVIGLVVGIWIVTVQQNNSEKHADEYMDCFRERVALDLPTDDC